MKLHLRGIRKILLDKGLFKISNRSTNPTFAHVALAYNSYTLHRYLQLIHLVADYSHICITKMLDIKKTDEQKEDQKTKGEDKTI